MPSPREGEQPFAFGCKGCGRVAKTERDLLAAGCEGTHEPLVFQSALTEAEEALREIGRVARRAIGEAEAAMSSIARHPMSVAAKEDTRRFRATRDELLDLLAPPPSSTEPREDGE